MNSTKNRKRVGLILGFMMMALGAMSCRDKGPDAKAAWIEDKIVSKLDLNKEQEGKLHDLVLAVQEQHKAHKQEAEAGRKQIKDMILADRLQQDQLRNLLNKKQAHLSQGFDAVYPKLEAFHASLNDDQKKEAVEYLEKFSKWHRD